jgi:hypothetical protein
MNKSKYLPVYNVYYLLNDKPLYFASFSIKMCWRYIKRYFKKIELSHSEYEKQKRIFYSNPEEYECIVGTGDKITVSVTKENNYTVLRKEVLKNLNRKDSKEIYLYRYTIKVISYMKKTGVKLGFTVSSTIVIVGSESILKRIKKSLIENHSFSEERAERILSNNQKELTSYCGFVCFDEGNYIKISSKIEICTDLSMY